MKHVARSKTGINLVVFGGFLLSIEITDFPLLRLLREYA